MSKDITIAVDANEANVPNRVGSNVYAFEILKGLEKWAGKRKQVSVVVLLSRPPLGDLPKERDGWKYRVIRPAALLTQFGLPLHLFTHQSKYDVFFTPGHYAPRFCPIPFVSSVMDVAYLLYPEQFKRTDLFQLKNWTAYSVKAAQKVIAISESTKKDVIKFYKRKQQDIIVATPALSQRQKPLLESRKRALLRKLKVHQPYFLFVGTLQPRKNVERLIKAFELLKSHAHDIHHPRVRKNLEAAALVLAGKTGWLAEPILEAIETSPLKSQIILTGFISDQEKQALYRDAEACVLPGLYEGFGLPPLEAMAESCLTVVSKTSSLPEVVGKAGTLVDPESIHSIAAGLLEVLSMSPSQRARRRKLGREQASLFSWQRSADIIGETLLDVVKQTR